jgi:type VI secretion system VgrG family protein
MPKPCFKLTVDSSDKAVFREFEVLEFTGMEAISQPYHFDLEVVSEKRNIEVEKLLNCQAFLLFDAGGRGVHGQIFRVGHADSGERQTRYRFSLVPRLAYLGQRINQRIFQQQSVPEIITQVLKDHGILKDAFKFQLSVDYPKREYCVQYAESDLAFIQRLCAEIGIHYHFQHSVDGHLLVFGDDQTVFPRLPEPGLFLPGRGLVAQTPVVNHFDVRLETRPTAVVRRDYDFHKPRLELESRRDSKQLPVLEDYAFPGHFNDCEIGNHLAGRALQRHRADYCQAQGGSDQPALMTGHFLQLDGHPRQAWNDLWLLTEIHHRGRQPQVLEELAGNDDADDFQGYRNTFLATPWDVFFRPSLIEKPHVGGYQLAVVTGPKNSEIHCDAFGRVKVRMMWDRRAKLYEHSSCWLRVASAWAHDGYGSVLTPRVGMEVLVGFVDGDADKPLVMGCLPNASTPIPLDLPADKTRSILRTRSSPDGGGYNELRIEDRKGAEEIYLRAQRNWTQHVLNDQRVQVDNQRSIVVTGIASHELKADEQRITHGQRRTEVKQDDHLLVTGDRRIRVTTQALNATQQFHVSAGQQVVIDGGVNATIQAGGHWINIGPGGIFSSAPIQVGGAPMVAMSAAPDLPGAPEKLQAAPASAAQIRSLKSPAAFCEECCKDGVCPAPSPLLGASKTKASKGAEPGFHIVEQPLSRTALEALLFPQSNPAVLKKFRNLNPQLGNFAKPGQMIVLSDPQNNQCTREEALLMEAAQKVDEALGPMSDVEAAFMALHYDEIESFLAQGSTAVGIGAAMFGKHLGNLNTTLKDLETLHKNTFDKHGKLTGADFFSQRKRLMSQLDNSLGPLMRKGAGIPDHPKLKTALGISSRSLVHHWSKAGTAGGIPGYATHIEGVSKASKVIKAGGWIGVGLGAGASGLKVKETCRVDTEGACRKVKFTEAGKFGGSFAGGVVSGALGVSTCAVIGVGTAGLGGVVCGIVVVGLGAATLGDAVGLAGETFGELIHEVTK